MSKILKDNLSFEDGLLQVPTQTSAFKTHIRAVDDFGNELWEDSNMTVLGGAMFTLMKSFGLDRGPIDIATVNELLEIANVPRKDIKDNFVSLFGIGTGGAGETAAQVLEVEVQERTMNKFLPMRTITTELPSVQKDKYWLRKELLDGKGTILYYLKKIQNIEIKCLWKDGVDGEDGSPVGDDVWNTTRTDAIETFVELTLRVDKVDGVEWFDYTANADQPEFSELGLFTGVRSSIGTDREDYCDVWLHSKLNIPKEVLHSGKGLTFYYRIYLM